METEYSIFINYMFFDNKIDIIHGSTFLVTIEKNLVFKIRRFQVFAIIIEYMRNSAKKTFGHVRSSSDSWKTPGLFPLFAPFSDPAKSLDSDTRLS